MNKVEMTLKEVYDEVLLDIYNNALESIKLVDESELKKELVVNYIKTLNIILLGGLKDEDISVSDFSYLVLQVNDLATTLTIRLCNSMIFGYYGCNMDKQVRIRYNTSKLQKLIRIELLKRLCDVDNE